jgi:hypothetical protein
MVILQILGLWISAACLIVAAWGALGVQWDRRATDMRERDFHGHGYVKQLLLERDR